MGEKEVFKEIFTDPKYEIPSAKLPFVWEIEYQGEISHLVGTWHRYPADFRDSFANLLCGKRQAAMEFAPHEYEENRMLFRQSEEYTAAVCIDSLTENEQQALAEVSGKTAETMRKMPLYHLYNLVNEQAAAQAGMPIRKMDIDLYKIAAENKILVHSLESPQDLAAAMVVLIPQIEEQVRWMARNPANDTAVLELQDLVSAYTQGDAAKCLSLRIAYLDQTMQEYCAAHPELVAERNKKMVRHGLDLLAAPTLIAVGLTHAIAEPGSMVSLYRDAGAKVERVPPPLPLPGEAVL